jgi:hypothetical protein
MKRVCLWAAVIIAAGFWLAASRPRAANPKQVPITIAVTAATNGQIECPH